MKICFNEATTIGNSTLAQDLVLCEQFGYDFIEIRLDKLREYLQTNTIADLSAFFASAHLKPYAFNALEGINFLSDAEWETLMSGFDLFCEVGKAIGCNKVVIVPTADVGDKTVGEIQASSLDAIAKINARAEKNGWPMQLALEFVGYPNLCINTFGQAYDIAEAANLDNVGVVLDCFHFYAMNSKWEDLARLDPKKLFIFHIDDSEDLPVGALRDDKRLWPGDGVIDMKRIFSVLKEKGYEEMASVELFRPEYYELPAADTIRIAKEKSVAVLSAFWEIG